MNKCYGHGGNPENVPGNAAEMATLTMVHQQQDWGTGEMTEIYKVLIFT